MKISITKAMLHGLCALSISLGLWSAIACQSNSPKNSVESSVSSSSIEEEPDSLWRFAIQPQTALYNTPDSTQTPFAHIPYGTLLALVEQKDNWTLVKCDIEVEPTEDAKTYQLWVPSHHVATLRQLALTPGLVQQEESPRRGTKATASAYEVQLIDKATFDKAKQDTLPRLRGKKWNKFPLTIRRHSDTTHITAEEAKNMEYGVGCIQELNLFYTRFRSRNRYFWSLYPAHKDIEKDYMCTDQPLCTPDKQWIFDEFWESGEVSANHIAEGEVTQSISTVFPCWRGLQDLYANGGVAFMDAKGWIYLQVWPNVLTKGIGDDELPHYYLRLRLRDLT